MPPPSIPAPLRLLGPRVLGLAVVDLGAGEKDRITEGLRPLGCSGYGPAGPSGKVMIFGRQ